MRYLYYNPFFYQEWRSGRRFLPASDPDWASSIKPDEIITETNASRNNRNDHENGLFEKPIGRDLEIILGLGRRGQPDKEEMSHYNLTTWINEGDELVFFSMLHCFTNLYSGLSGLLETFEDKKLKVEFYDDGFCLDYSDRRPDMLKKTDVKSSMIQNFNSYVNNYSKRAVERSKANTLRYERQKKRLKKN